MSDPKPVIPTVGANPGSYDPEPIILVDIPGYDAGETQTLKHVSGVLTWVTDV